MTDVTATNVCTAGSPMYSDGTADELNAQYGGPSVQIEPADGLMGSLGLYRVTVNGQTQLMTRAEIEMGNLNPPAPQTAVPAGATASISISTARVANNSCPVPAKGNPTIVAASADVIMTASAMEMANRTGYPVTGLSKGSLSNTSDVTVIAHGIRGTNNIEVGGRSLTPKQFAREMYDAGWRGGTMRLAICTSCTGGPSVAQEVANEFAKLGAETAIIAPAGVGKVSELGGVHGLPQVRDPNMPDRMPPGEGWEVTTPTVPSEIPGAMRTGARVAGIGLNAINVIQTLKFAWDFKKMMDFGDSLRSGQYFQDFWSQVSALPDGSKVEMDGEIGTVDMSNGIAIHFKNSQSSWTVKMVSDGQGGFGMHITGTDHGTMVDYRIDRNGVRGGEIV